MKHSRLNIIKDAHPIEKMIHKNNGSRKSVVQAEMEKQWLQNPQQFDVNRNCMEKERINRTWSLLTDTCLPKDLFACDLGCGSGSFSQKLKNAGALVHALDISQNALKFLNDPSKKIKTYQGYLPRTTLKDETYDIVACLDVIAYLHPNEYRLLFSELARLVKADGFVICSTPIDINSEDALSQFANLASTEFKFIKWSFSYHRFYLRILEFFRAPKQFAQGMNEPEYRAIQIQKRYALSRCWYRLNSTKPIGWFWKGISFISTPISSCLLHCRSCMLFFEKLSRILRNDSGISHAIFIAKRRSLTEEAPKSTPTEIKHKKQVWE